MTTECCGRKCNLCPDFNQNCILRNELDLTKDFFGLYYRGKQIYVNIENNFNYIQTQVDGYIKSIKETSADKLNVPLEKEMDTVRNSLDAYEVCKKVITYVTDYTRFGIGNTIFSNYPSYTSLMNIDNLPNTIDAIINVKFIPTANGGSASGWSPVGKRPPEEALYYISNTNNIFYVKESYQDENPTTITLDIGTYNIMGLKDEIFTQLNGALRKYIYNVTANISLNINGQYEIIIDIIMEFDRRTGQPVTEDDIMAIYTPPLGSKVLGFPNDHFVTSINNIIQTTTIMLPITEITIAHLSVATLAHEFCHSLGMIHTHQNAANNPTREENFWNRGNIYKFYVSKEGLETGIAKARFNIFDIYPLSTGPGFDPFSIMMYPIPKCWNNKNIEFKMTYILSNLDKNSLFTIYPPIIDIIENDRQKSITLNSSTTNSSSINIVYLIIIIVSIILILLVSN